jgi:hypothetical protein
VVEKYAFSLFGNNSNWCISFANDRQHRE